MLGEDNWQVTRMQRMCYWVIITHAADNPNLQKENIQFNKNTLGTTVSLCSLESLGWQGLHLIKLQKPVRKQASPGIYGHENFFLILKECV